MRTSSKPSRSFTGPFILATAGLSLFAINCGDDAASTTGTAGTSTLPMSGAGGSASQGGSGAGMAGTTTTAGTSTTAGTTGTAGTATAAGSGGVGGGSAGSGGSGGSGGGSSGSGGGGGSAAAFGPVQSLLAMSCKGGKCHDAASMQMDFTTADGLYMRLTSPIPNDIPHCPGDALVNKGMPDQSLLVRVLKGSTMCSKAGGGMEQIARMPDHCGEGGNNPPCLTEMQIKVVSDWVAAGAPQ
ncbi:MAG TPA: hypothetical protein VHP33_31435 [Polyangiaceae bacterium]|nr:hypothetical protein [Polyangiaceae bacterium]